MANQLRLVMEMERRTFAGLISVASRRAIKADRVHHAQVHAKVRRWAEEAVSGSAKAGHNFLKKADVKVQGQEGVDMDETHVFCDPCKSVEDRANTWSKLWQRDANKNNMLAAAIQNLRVLAKSSDHEMDTIDDDDVEQAIAGLRNSRGLGLDHWAPVDWKRLPPKAKKGLGDTLRKAEKDLTVPSQALLQLMPLMRKPSGGSAHSPCRHCGTSFGRPSEGGKSDDGMLTWPSIGTRRSRAGRPKTPVSCEDCWMS